MEFWQMGGYGFYVWLAYGLTGLVLVYNLVRPYWRHKQLLTQLRQLQLEESKYNESR